MKSALTNIRIVQIFGLLLFIYALRPLEAFDTFWQLQSGKYILQTGQFIYQDTFGLASETPRMEHCWLHDVFLYLVYTLGGYPLLALLKPVFISLSGGLLLFWNLRRGQAPAIVLPVLLVCLVGSADSWLVRPQLWTFLFSILYLILLFAGRESGWRAWVWLIPLMLLWANLHAACIFGFALVVAFGMGEVWRALRQQTSWHQVGVFGLIGLACFASAFVNPYGYHIPVGKLLAHLDQTSVMTGTAHIKMLWNMEWLPPTFSQAPLFFIIVAVWGLLVVWRLLQKRLDAAELFYFIGFSYMGFSQIRHTTLVALLAAFFIPAAIQQLWCGWTRRSELTWKPGWWQVVPGMLILLTLLGSSAVKGQLGSSLKAGQYPVAAAEFVKTKRLPANLYNAYDWGGYLMWSLYPDYLVYVDGRAINDVLFESSSRIENSWQGWQTDLELNNVQTIVTRTCFYDSGGPLNLITMLSRSREWDLVFQDDVALVYLRSQKARELDLPVIPRSKAWSTMLAEATRLQQDSFPRPRVHLSFARAYMGLGEFSKARASYALHARAEPTIAKQR